MGLFSNAAEDERKANLKKMEDKRLAFAQEQDRRGFKPEKMLFSQTSNGGLAAVCDFNGQKWVIVGPGLGTDEDFTMEPFDAFNVRCEEVHIKAEGLGGMFGFGKKGQQGLEYVLTRQDGSEVRIPFVYGLNGWGEFALKRNPLLSTKRRRHDANVVWDLRPIDNVDLKKIRDVVQRYF